MWKIVYRREMVLGLQRWPGTMSRLHLICVSVLLSCTLSCTPTSPEEGVSQTGAHADSATVQLVFDTSLSEVRPSRALARGDLVSVKYDPNRMRKIINRSQGGRDDYGYFASQHHCYGYGCCEVTFPRLYVHYRFSADGDWGTWIDRHMPEDTHELTLKVPDDADELDLWFDVKQFNIHSYYCGCDLACQEAYYEQSSPRLVDFQAYDTRVANGYFSYPIGQGT